MDVRRTRYCQKCRIAVPLDQVRLYAKDHETSVLLCEPCCEEVKRNTSSSPRLRSNVPNLPPPELARNHCRRCNYSFRVDRSKVGVTFNMTCPYCGKNDKLQF